MDRALPRPLKFRPWGYPNRGSMLGLSAATAMTVGLGLALLSWRHASFSLAVVAMLVSIPVLHGHYWLWLLVPFMSIWLPTAMDHLTGVSGSARRRSV